MNALAMIPECIAQAWDKYKYLIDWPPTRQVEYDSHNSLDFYDTPNPRQIQPNLCKYSRLYWSGPPFVPALPLNWTWR